MSTLGNVVMIVVDALAIVPAFVLDVLNLVFGGKYQGNQDWVTKREEGNCAIILAVILLVAIVLLFTVVFQQGSSGSGSGLKEVFCGFLEGGCK